VKKKAELPYLMNRLLNLKVVGHSKTRKTTTKKRMSKKKKEMKMSLEDLQKSVRSNSYQVTSKFRLDVAMKILRLRSLPTHQRNTLFDQTNDTKFKSTGSKTHQNERWVGLDFLKNVRSE
jgi:hypothetical protein